MGQRKGTKGRAQALKRIAEPDDIGGAFLASEDTRWITGDTIHKRRTDMLMLDRRTLLRAGSAAVAVGAAALAPTAPALASAPQVGKQAQPGFYRFSSSDLGGCTQRPVGGSSPRRCRASEHRNAEPDHSANSRG